MYKPCSRMLKRYADVLVKFALRQGKGVKKGETVFVQLPECAKRFYIPLQKSILEAGAHPIIEYFPDGVAKSFYENASDEQISHYPAALLKGKIDQMDHVISIVAEADKYELKNIDPKKLAARRLSRKPFIDMRRAKENAGKHSRTIGMYGTPAMAAEVGLSEKVYRDQIIKACYLDHKDPIAQWRKTVKNIEKIQKRLDKMKIESVHVEGPDADLTVKIGSDRRRLGGRGNNIPSFEIFTSPHRKGTEGWVKINQPLYVYGQMIEGIELHFEKGIVTKYSAKKNKKLLKEMLAIPGANKLGEFSLTDGRISHITKFMGETLYDENVGGKLGNMHVAIGAAFMESWTGDIKKLTRKKATSLGFNDSAEHKDLVSTAKKTVTATLANGKEKVIYKDGQFMLNIK